MVTFIGLLGLIMGVLFALHAFMYIYLPEKDIMDQHIAFVWCVFTTISFLVSALALMSGSVTMDSIQAYLFAISLILNVLRIVVSVVGITRLYKHNIRRYRNG